MPSSDTSHSVLYSASFSLAATTFVSGISWGVMTCLYAVCMHSLIRELRSTTIARRTALLTAWITALWISSSISTLANAYCPIYAYSWQMDYPGGPAAYLADQWNAPIPLLASSAYILTMWLADALMLWRLVIFCHGVHPLARGLILSFMFFIYIGVVGTASFMIAVESANQTVYSELGMKAAIPCFTLSVTLNVLATAFISFRLFMFKKLTECALDRKEAGASPYTSVAAIITESSALYAVWSLVFIIGYAVDSPAQYILLMTLCNVQVIAPVLIVYRVSKGMGWEKTTSEELTSTHLLFADLESPAAKPPVMCSSERPEELASDLKMELTNLSHVASNVSCNEC